MAAPQGGERERPCEIITPPLTADHAVALEDLLGPARELGFTIPQRPPCTCTSTAPRSATGHPGQRHPAVRLLPRAAAHAAADQPQLPAPRPTAAAAGHERSPARPPGRPQDAATDGGLTKFFDVNMAQLFRDNPDPRHPRDPHPPRRPPHRGHHQPRRPDRAPPGPLRRPVPDPRGPRRPGRSPQSPPRAGSRSPRQPALASEPGHAGPRLAGPRPSRACAAAGPQGRRAKYCAAQRDATTSCGVVRQIWAIVSDSRTYVSWPDVIGPRLTPVAAGGCGV